MTSGLSFFYRNHVLSDTIFATGLIAFIYVDDYIVLTLFRPSSLITT